MNEVPEEFAIAEGDCTYDYWGDSIINLAMPFLKICYLFVSILNLLM